jgi:hypothetical protein
MNFSENLLHIRNQSKAASSWRSETQTNQTKRMNIG